MHDNEKLFAAGRIKYILKSSVTFLVLRLEFVRRVPARC